MIKKAFKVYINSFGGLSKPVWLLGLVTLINRMGTMVIPFLTVYLTQELHFPLKDAGIVMMFFGAGSLVGTYIGGYLTDKTGFYHVQFWSLLLAGLMFYVLMHMHTFTEWCVAIFFHGVIADAFRPAMMASVATYSKPQNRTRSVTLIRLAINLGWALGPAIGGFLAKTAGYDWLFWVDGLTCVAAAFLFRIALPKKQQIQETPEAEAVPVNSVYRDRLFLAFIFLNTIGAIAFFQLLSTQPVFFKEILLLDEAQIGGLMAINGLLIAIFEMPIVYILEKRFRLLRIITLGCILIGISYLMYNLTGWVGIAVLSMLVVTIGEIMTMPFANAFALSRASDTNRGRYMALYGISYSVAFMGAPFIGSVIADDWGFYTLWIVVGLISFVAAFGFNYLRKYV